MRRAFTSLPLIAAFFSAGLLLPALHQTALATNTTARDTDPAWTLASSGDHLGAANLLARDLNGDNIPEIIASAALSNTTAQRFWTIASLADGLIEPSFTSDLTSGRTITKLRAADFDGDDVDEIWVAYSDLTIEIFDPWCHTPLATVDCGTTLSSWSDIQIDDVDDDGILEIVTMGPEGVSIYNGVDPFALEQNLAAYANHDMVIGQMEDDLVLEIALVGNTRSYVIEFDGTIEWEYLLGFGSDVTAGDIDGDGRDELIGDVGSSVAAFDVELRLTKWENPLNQTFSGFVIGNVDTRAGVEIIGWNSQNNRLNLIAGADGTTVGSFTYEELATIVGFTLADVNQNNRSELIGAGVRNFNFTSTMAAVDYPSATPLFLNRKMPGPLHHFAVSDLAGDGDQALLVVPPEYESSVDPRLLVVDATTQAVTRTISFLGGGFTVHGQPLIAIANLDSDPAREIVFVATESFQTVIRIYDGVTGAVQQAGAPISDEFSRITVADVDGDNVLDLIAVSANRIHRFSTQTLTETWRSREVNFSPITNLAVADTDGDRALELVVCGNGTDVLIFDGDTGFLDFIEGSYTAVTLTNWDNQETNDFLLGTSTGLIEVHSGSPPALVATRDTGLGSALNAVKLAQIDSATDRFWFAASTTTLVADNDENSERIWQSQYGMSHLALGNQLPIADLDGNGSGEILAGGAHTLAAFEINCGAPLMRARLNHWGTPWLVTDYSRMINCASP